MVAEIGILRPRGDERFTPADGFRSKMMGALLVGDAQCGADGAG
jgi:hypothetical protein